MQIHKHFFSLEEGCQSQVLPFYQLLLFPKSLLLLQSDKLHKELKKLLATGANSAPFCGVSCFRPAMITVLFFFHPTNYVLSKLHITVEFVLRLMYIKTSQVSESVSQAPPGACVSTYSCLPFVLLGSFCFLLHS